MKKYPLNRVGNGRFTRRLLRVGGLLLAVLGPAGCGDAGTSVEGGEPTDSVEQAIIFIPHCTLPTVLKCDITHCWCVTPPPPPQPQTGSLTPEFYITHVVYAPPGKLSNIDYSSSTSVGSTTSTSKGFKTGVKIEAEASSSVLGGSGVSASFEKNGSTNKTDAIDVSLKYSQGYKKTGQVDSVDHNYDEIWFIVRPKLDFTYLRAPTVGGQDTIKWKFGAQDGVNNGIPYFVYAGWLNNAMVMPERVRMDLDFWGITPDEYSKLLAADPLFTGTTPNMTMNPERYKQVGVYPYLPPFAEGGSEASTQTFSVENSRTDTTTRDYDFDTSVGLGVTIGGNFGVVETKLTVSGSWTWTNSSSTSRSTETESTDSFTVGQPAFGYSGPTLLRVYLDKVFGTYAFTLDYPQGETNLSFNRFSWQSSDLPGYSAGASLANDGNTDGNFWDGSVTHTDWGLTYNVPNVAGQWWAVDLGSERVVNKVKIFNRTDCCSERLSHYRILAWDSKAFTWNVVSDHSADDTTGVPFFEVPIDMVRTQYVMVAKMDDNYLSLAEVQVLGF